VRSFDGCEVEPAAVNDQGQKATLQGDRRISALPLRADITGFINQYTSGAALFTRHFFLQRNSQPS